MYKIIGIDQKIYGPVPAEQIRRWINEGRVNASTLAQAEGSVDWKPISSYPEFAAPPLITPAPISVPPREPAAADFGSNTAATTGFILGLLSLLFCWLCCFDTLFAALGIIFSSIGLSRANAHPQQIGKSYATAGLVLSVLALLKGFLFMGWLTFFSHLSQLGRHWDM